MIEKSPLCPFCREGHSEIYLKLPDRFQLDEELYHIYSCVSCGLIFLHPQPSESETAGHYSDAGYDPFLEVEGARSWSQRIYAWVKPWALEWKAKLIARSLSQPGSILDVGAGTGAFLNVMKAKGWETLGIEKNENAADYARKKLKLEIITDDLADYSSLNRPLDAVTFWHSLEHIHRPKENLAVVRENLKPGGFLFIALPNPDSLDARFYKRHWVAWDAPRHLWHFRPKVMANLLDEFGFNLRKVIPMPLDPFYNCLQSEFLVPGGGKLGRYALRLPMMAKLSFINGLFCPLKASSVVYVSNLKQA